MIQLNPYLTLAGTTEEAFTFYKSVFGGEFVTFQRFKETPDGDKMPTADGEKIMHVAFKIGDNTLMCTDALPSQGRAVTMGDNISLSLNMDSRKESDELYIKLAVGGTPEMSMQEMFWGAYFGMLTDRFGVKWMINCDAK